MLKKMIKKLFSKKLFSAAVCICLLMFPVASFAESPVFSFTVPKFSLGAPYVVYNGIVYNFIKEPGNVSLGEVSVGNNRFAARSDVSIPNVITIKGKSYAVTKIEDGAFFQNSSVETISFGKSIESVSAAAFLNCGSLKEINVVSDSPYFKSENGVLYSANYNSLIKYPDSKCDSSYSVRIEAEKIGDFAFFGNNFIKEVSMPVNLYEIGIGAFADCSFIETVKMGVNVKKLGDYSFYKSGIKTISLSPEITDIGKGAFAYSDIYRISLPSSLEEIKEGLFYNCENLSELTLGSNLHKIGDYAFSNIKASSLTLPDNVNSIGSYAFSNCEYLKSVSLNSALSSIGDNAFYNCRSITTIDLPKSLSSLGNDVFTGCTSLETFTAKRGNPGSYTIEDGILYNKNVTSLIHYPSANISSVYTIPSSLTEICDNALADSKYINEFNLNASGRYFYVEDGILYDYHMTKLIKYPLGKSGVDFTIPDTVREIANGAFKNSDIAGIMNLSPALEKIGDYAFSGCSNISSFSTNNNNYFTTENGVLYTKDMTELIQFPAKSSIKDFVLPDTVTEIHTGAFNSIDLNTIQLNSGLEKIGDYAFYDVDISEISLPENLKEIGDFSFANTNISQITFPSSIEKIGDYSFNDCTSLKEIKFTSENPPEIKSDAFLGCGNLSTIKLLSGASGSIDKYIECLTSLNIDDVDDLIFIEE